MDLTGLTSRCQQPEFPLESPGSGGHLCPGFFQVLWATPIPWLEASPCIFKAVISSLQPCFCHHTSFSDSQATCLPLSLVITSYYLIIQANFPLSRFLITSAKFLLPCSITYSQVLGIWLWTSWGSLFGLPQSLMHLNLNPDSNIVLDFLSL